MNKYTRRNADGSAYVDSAFAQRLDRYTTDGEAIDRLAAYEDAGLTSERCAELAKAEREGRLHIAPCANGTDIWYLNRNCAGMITLIYPDKYRMGATEYCHGEINKDWFLTREEAIKALESEV